MITAPIKAGRKPGAPQQLTESGAHLGDLQSSHADVRVEPEKRRSPATARRGSARLRWLLVGLDAIALTASWIPFLLLTDGARLTGGHVARASTMLLAVVGATAAAVCVAWFRGLYRSRGCSIKEEEWVLLVSVAVASAIAGAVVLRLLGTRPSLGAFVADVALAWILLAAARSGYRSWLSARRRRGDFTRPVVVVGANEEARYWCKHFADHPELGCDVRGFIGEFDPNVDISSAPRLGSPSEAVKLAHEAGASGVIVMVSAFSMSELRALLREFARTNLHVEISTGVLGIASDRLTMTSMAHENLLYIERRSRLGRSRVVKRAFDLVVTVAALVLTSPVLIVAALVIRHEHDGPVFFHQERIGRDGKPFLLHKFRSMVPGAEARCGELAAENQREGPLFKAAVDPRVTRVGKILRVTSIDELPQLWNVLRGEMSLCGPRPALPGEVSQFEPALLARHEVLPGITGLWQVEARHSASFDSYQKLDLHYVENWSILLDISILASTMTSLIGEILRAFSAHMKKGRVKLDYEGRTELADAAIPLAQ